MYPFRPIEAVLIISTCHLCTCTTIVGKTSVISKLWIQLANHSQHRGCAQASHAFFLMNWPLFNGCSYIYVTWYTCVQHTHCSWHRQSNIWCYGASTGMQPLISLNVQIQTDSLFKALVISTSIITKPFGCKLQVHSRVNRMLVSALCIHLGHAVIQCKVDCSGICQYTSCHAKV